MNEREFSDEVVERVAKAVTPWLWDENKLWLEGTFQETPEQVRDRLRSADRRRVRAVIEAFQTHSKGAGDE